MLEVRDLRKAFAGFVAVGGVSLSVETRQIAAVIGPNGAGKSTLLRTIFGLIKPHRGYIRLAGAPINGREPAAIKALGIGYVPQEINVFPLLTIEENLRMGGWIFRRDRARLTSALDRVFATFPVLANRRSTAAGTLSGGQGRMLSVAREMMSAPDLMLVDEPTAGLSPALVSQVYELLHAARRAGSTVLLVDQNIEDAVREADHVYLVDLGRVRAHGLAREFPGARVRALIQECLLQ